VQQQIIIIFLLSGHFAIGASAGCFLMHTSRFRKLTSSFCGYRSLSHRSKSFFLTILLSLAQHVCSRLGQLDNCSFANRWNRAKWR